MLCLFVASPSVHFGFIVYAFLKDHSSASVPDTHVPGVGTLRKNVPEITILNVYCVISHCGSAASEGNILVKAA